MPNFIEIEETLCGRTDGRTHVRTYGYLWPALLGRLCDLKTGKTQDSAGKQQLQHALTDMNVTWPSVAADRINVTCKWWINMWDNQIQQNAQYRVNSDNDCSYHSLSTANVVMQRYHMNISQWQICNVKYSLQYKISLSFQTVKNTICYRILLTLVPSTRVWHYWLKIKPNN